MLAVVVLVVNLICAVVMSPDDVRVGGDDVDVDDDVGVRVAGGGVELAVNAGDDGDGEVAEAAVDLGVHLVELLGVLPAAGDEGAVVGAAAAGQRRWWRMSRRRRRRGPWGARRCRRRARRASGTSSCSASPSSPRRRCRSRC